MSNWKYYFDDAQTITLDDFEIDKTWKTIIYKKEKQINKILNEIYCTKSKVFPEPENLFSAFNFTPLNKIKAILIGQDPYHNSSNVRYSDGDIVNVPQAHGLAFSVNEDLPIPSSLRNIHKNLLKFGLISKLPENGNLEYLAKQGIFMINMSLTVQENKPGSHIKLWKNIISEILIDAVKSIISTNNKCTILCFGKFACLIKKNIPKSNLINWSISSHPSGLSCNKSMVYEGVKYNSFNDTDHFSHLKENSGIKFEL